ncbi:MAG: ROK family protein [Gemmatimonadaceae bacterium]|nr:ROK family protein [Gemmatimonadaceae bacterium]MDQ3518920.1 ROK family protein [Gemmatimonadota bacterium]
MRLAGAIDIGGTATKIGIVAEDGSVVKSETIPTSPLGEPIALVDAIVLSLQPLLDAEKAAGKSVAGVGVSVAGFLDSERSAMIQNANLPALRGFQLRRALEERLSLECRLEVDSNAAVVAEYRYGAGRGATRLLGVTLGTGLGGGVIIDGELLHFTGECAGDLGHIILDSKGRACTCGARGCLEAMVSSAALSERAGGRPVREIVSEARREDPLALKALAETGWWLGLGLASLSPVFSPDRIVIGGGISAAGDALLNSVRSSYRVHASPGFREKTRIIGSSFEGWEGMIGAASLTLNPLS